MGESVVGTFLTRPGAKDFLREMSKFFEVVIFTAAMQDVSFDSWLIYSVCWLGTKSTRYWKPHFLQIISSAYVAKRIMLYQGKNITKTNNIRIYLE